MTPLQKQLLEDESRHSIEDTGFNLRWFQMCQGQHMAHLLHAQKAAREEWLLFGAYFFERLQPDLPQED